MSGLTEKSIHGDEVIRVEYALIRRRWEEDYYVVNAENGALSKAEAIRKVEDYRIDSHNSSHLKETKPKVTDVVITFKCRNTGNVYTDLPIDTEHNVGDFGWHYTSKCSGEYKYDWVNKVCYTCKHADEEGYRLLTDKELHDLNNTGWLYNE